MGGLTHAKPHMFDAHLEILGEMINTGEISPQQIHKKTSKSWLGIKNDPLPVKKSQC